MVIVFAIFRAQEKPKKVFPFVSRHCSHACVVPHCLQAETYVGMVEWFSAYELFALSAHATKVWDYAAIRVHIMICKQIACK